MTQAHESAADSQDNSSSAANPYQPPADGNVNHLIRRRSAVPGSDFWFVAITSFVFVVFITYLMQGIAFPIVVALPAAVVRVCLIYWRRSSLGLDELASIPLLFSSTLVALGLGLSCIIGFGGICTGSAMAVGSVFQGSPYGVLLAITLVSAVAGFAAFIVLLVWSIKWAS